LGQKEKRVSIIPLRVVGERKFQNAGARKKGMKKGRPRRARGGAWKGKKVGMYISEEGPKVFAKPKVSSERQKGQIPPTKDKAFLKGKRNERTDGKRKTQG